MKRELFLWLAVGLMMSPVTASACIFGFQSIPSLNTSSSDIFIGRVVASPWTRDGNLTTTRAGTVRFVVERRFRGAADAEITLDGGLGNCVFPFLPGERYLVHAQRIDGVLQSGQPHRPMLIPDAAEVLKYLEAKAANRPVASFYGGLGLRNESVGPFDFTLKLEGKDDSYSFKLERHRFEMTLAPGEYRIWFEVGGRPVSEALTVELQPRRDPKVVEPSRELRLNIGGVLLDAALVFSLE
jgi:hypothetical protein